MAQTFYVNMQKRADGKVYADLHKTSSVLYHDLKEAQEDLTYDEYRMSKHTVELVALTKEEYEELMKGKDELRY